MMLNVFFLSAIMPKYLVKMLGLLARVVVILSLVVSAIFTWVSLNQNQSILFWPITYRRGRQSNEPIKLEANACRWRQERENACKWVTFGFWCNFDWREICSQSQSAAIQNQSNCGITFDTQLKTALTQLTFCVDITGQVKWSTFPLMFTVAPAGLLITRNVIVSLSSAVISRWIVSWSVEFISLGTFTILGGKFSVCEDKKIKQALNGI